MASPVTVEVEEHSNTKTEEGTTAFHKKRSRRVSFAENTSVHIFDRDQTPLDPEPPSSPHEGLGLDERDCNSRQFFENQDDGDMDELGPRSPFIRVIGSPSSGGSTIGSATSNDEDNFFGPVSTSFIRQDLSASAASDDNHDQTMDSTAFSMHFKSLARSDSEGDLKTSARTPLSFEEKTPTPRSIPSDTRSSMQLTLVNKPNSQPDVSTSKSSTGSQSNDMSLVGEYHDKYDYGKLSPALDPRLAEDDNDLHVVSHISELRSPIEAGNQEENRSDLMYFSYGQDNKMQGTTSHEELNEVVSAEHKIGVGDDGSEFLRSKQIAAGVSSNTCDPQALKPLYPNQSIKGPVKDAYGISSSLESLATSQGTPLNHVSMVHQLDDLIEKENNSSLVKSITHLTDRPSHELIHGVSLLKSPGTVTPSNNQASVLKTKTTASSLRKSMSKLRILEASPFSAALNAKLEDSNSRSLAGLSKMTSLGDLLGKEGAYTNMDDNKNMIRKNLVPITRKENFAEVATQLVLPSENTWPGEHLQQNLFGRSPSNKELYSVFLNESIDSFHAKNVQSSRLNQLSNEDVNSAERKRKIEHVTTDKIAKIKKSSNSALKLPSDSGMSCIGPNLEHLAEIHTRFFNQTKLLPHSVDKMNLHAIDRLVDILGQLQRSKTYQLLSNEFQSQTIVDLGCNIRAKRRAETKMILAKFVHEQVKLQLMRVKRERLLKNMQSLSSGIQESEALKLNHSPHNSVDVQLIHQAPSLHRFKDIKECQVDNNIVNSMRQEIKDINRRISNLKESFHISCKMKGEPNTADTITTAENHLMKRAQCQIIRKDLQLWVIDDLKSSKDHHNVVLNYLDLMIQRLTVTAGVVPSVSVSIILNEMNIQRNFKDMDALTAFGFVFDAGLIEKHLSTTSLAQETQITSSLLGNLVDVMEEIQLATIELKNLVYARFHTSLDDRLDLELYFCDSNNRKKASVTLNTSCLKRGIYPSEIVACQIDIPVDESHILSKEKLSADIAAAVQDLRVGYLRILRLCRCISRLVSLQGNNNLTIN